MKSQRLGKNISAAEILNVSKFGIWMLIQEREYFLRYKDFPWFQNASVKQIYSFEFLHGRHLYWKDLDIDLSLDSISTPERFPLKAQIGGEAASNFIFKSKFQKKCDSCRAMFDGRRAHA